MNELNQKIIKKSDFYQWFNSNIYKTALLHECKGKIDLAQINTLSYMFATIFAMKARDYVNFKTDKDPGSIELDASKCAKNIRKYLLNYPAIKKDWIELFMIGYSGLSANLEVQDVEMSLVQENIEEIDEQDDHYGKNAALFVMSLDSSLSEAQELQIIRSLIQKINNRKDKTKELLARKKLQDKLTVKNVIKKFKEKKAAQTNKPQRKLKITEYVFQGVSSSVLAIIGVKMIPILGPLAPYVMGGVGYFASPKAFDLVLSLKILKNNKDVWFGREMNKSQSAKKEPSLVCEQEVSQLYSLKKKISMDIKRQQETISQYDLQASNELSNVSKTSSLGVSQDIKFHGSAVNKSFEEIEGVQDIQRKFQDKQGLIRGEKESVEEKGEAVYKSKSAEKKTIS